MWGSGAPQGEEPASQPQGEPPAAPSQPPSTPPPEPAAAPPPSTPLWGPDAAPAQTSPPGADKPPAAPPPSTPLWGAGAAPAQTPPPASTPPAAAPPPAQPMWGEQAPPPQPTPAPDAGGPPPAAQPGWGQQPASAPPPAPAGPPPAGGMWGGGAPPPATVKPEGIPGCLKVAIIVGGILIVLLILFVFALGQLANGLLRSAGVNPDEAGNGGANGIGADCPFLSDAAAREVVGGQADASEFSGLLQATLGLVIDMRALPNAPDCVITDGQKTYLVRIAKRDGNGPAVYAQEKANAQPTSQDQGGGVT